MSKNQLRFNFARINCSHHNKLVLHLNFLKWYHMVHMIWTNSREFSRRTTSERKMNIAYILYRLYYPMRISIYLLAWAAAGLQFPFPIGHLNMKYGTYNMLHMCRKWIWHVVLLIGHATDSPKSWLIRVKINSYIKICHKNLV